jgi:hypothetical protein
MTAARHIALAVAALLLAAAAYAEPGTVTLGWRLPTTNTDGTAITNLVGARIYYGTTSSNYTSRLDLGLVTNCVISNLVAGTTYYCNGTAYNAAGLESDFCDEVVKTAVDTTPQVPGPYDALWAGLARRQVMMIRIVSGKYVPVVIWQQETTNGWIEVTP